MATGDVRPVGDQEIEFDEKKLRELILYISARFGGELYWGAVKLNKVLFNADFEAHRRLGHPITGADYMALERGPAPRALLPIRESMRANHEIAIQQFGRQELVVALRPADLSGFTADEIAIVDEVCLALRDDDAKRVSDASHLFLGWQAAIAQGEKTSIPYSTAFVTSPRLDFFEESHVLDLAAKHQWPLQTT